MLKASLKDISILDGYLHDSYFKPEDIVFNADQRCFTMDLERKSEDTIVLGSTHFKITLTVAPDFELTLTDAPEPEDGPRITDFFKGIFRGMDEIDRLRVNAQPTGAPDKK